MDLGKLVCKGCNGVLGKLRGGARRVQGKPFGPGARACWRCQPVPVRYDPRAPHGVTA